MESKKQLTNEEFLDGLDELFSAASEEDLKSLLVTHDEVQEFKASIGPQTKEEFAQVFKDEIGISLGTVAVCPGHSSQLDVFWEIYSFAVRNVLVVFNRGGGKTSGMAWVDYLSAKYMPGFTSFTIGPGMDQGKRKYEHILPFVVEGGVWGGKPLTSAGISRSTTQETNWDNGSKIEISLGGGVANANGPRTVRLHRDETELMDSATYKQAANIPAGKMTRDGRYMPNQIVDTSTMKFAGGLIDLQIKQYNTEVENGQRPSLEVRICCIFEMTQENPACQSVPEEERRARLLELGRDPDELCDCHTYSKDYWEAEGDAEPEPRTLDKVCNGRFFRSRGYKDFTDVQLLFSTNDRQTWNAEQECSEPSGEGVFLKAYSQVRHGIKNYEPEPQNGTIYQGVDWGGTDEHAVAWYQLIERDDVYADYWISGERRHIPRGTLVVFDEIFVGGIGDTELGQIVVRRENEYIKKYPGWRVHERFPDSANASGRMNWRDQCQLTTVTRIAKDFLAEVKYVRTRVGGPEFAVCIDKCKKFDQSIRGWRQENGREVHDENCFVAETPIMTEGGERPIISIKAGERVWTREGLKEVLWSGQTKVDETIIVELDDDRQLECTAEHRFWTERGWVQAQNLLSTDMVSVWRSLKSGSSTSDRSSFTEVFDSRELSVMASSDLPTSWVVPTEGTGLSIVTCGPANAETSPKGTKSITSMPTPATTRSTTSNASLSPSTESSLDTAVIDNLSILLESGHSPAKRWLAKKFVKLSRSNAQSGGNTAVQTSTPVSAVAIFSSRDRLDLQSSARTTVSPKLAGNQESIKSNEPADIAAVPSSSTSTLVPSTALVRVRKVLPGHGAKPVYDLHVAECHEFFAQGTVVHNSHMMAQFRYVEHNLAIIFNKKKRAETSSGSGPVAADDENRREERGEELDRSVTISRINDGDSDLNAFGPEVTDLGWVGDASPFAGDPLNMDMPDDYRTLG